MKKSEKYYLDIEKLCKIKGSMFCYFVNAENVITACNELKLNFLKDLFGCDKAIGINLTQHLKNAKIISARDCYSQNSDVLKKGLPIHCYHSWSIKGSYKLDLLTTKIPTYNSSGKPAGVFVTSHFLNKISLQQAYEMNFTPREAECLLYLFEGYTAKEIAKVIKLSFRTVEGYIDNMKLKQQCTTTSELLLKAIKNNIKIGVSEVFKSDCLNLPSELIRGENAHSCLIDGLEK